VLYQAELHPEIKPRIVLQIRLLDNRICAIGPTIHEPPKKTIRQRVKSFHRQTNSVKFA
jgi:hypothetical protein